MTNATDEYRKKRKAEKWQAETRGAILDAALKAHHDGQVPQGFQKWNDPTRWHDKAELTASMERLRAYEESKGHPLPEPKEVEQ